MVRLQKELTEMNQILRRSFCITALLASCVATAVTIPYLAPRSQGINGARELVGWQSQINKWDMCCMYGSFSITPEYTRTFKPNRITEALFGDALVANTSCCPTSCNSSCHNGDNCGCNTLLIQGTKVENRNSKALMAENFYLPSDYSSVITLEPRVENFLVDLNYYQGLDEWVEGMYFRIHTPITWTRWDLNYCEKIVDAGTEPMDIGYFNNTYTSTTTSGYGLARESLLTSFQQYANDCKSITGVDGIVYNPLQRARWNSCRMSKTRLAEITAAWGWNFVRRENFLFGLNIRAAAPTGNRPNGNYIFEPIVGNGKHWELGGGMNMWWTWWRSCDEDRNFTMYLDAYATHMFKTHQCRTFDLCGKPLSRYMLAMKFTDKVQDLYAGELGSLAAPSAQFANEFTPVANLTTIPVDVSYAAQGEVVLKFAYTHCNFQFDFGYDFWGRTCAKICKRCDCCDNGFADNVWGLKGDAFVYGFVETQGVLAPKGTPLSATQSQATIFGGTNNYPDGTTAGNWNQNPGIDNAQPAYANEAGTIGLFTKQNGNANWNIVLTSLQPVLLTEADLDINAARTKAYSNKVFAHFGYTWKECECWTPYLGIGGEVEIGARANCCKDNCHTPCVNTCNTTCHTTCNTSCHNGDNTNCAKFALSQWGIWLKGGVSFN
jgi:hypothetical protein